jgi:hypothetical protein
LNLSVSQVIIVGDAERGGQGHPHYEALPCALDLRRYHDCQHLCQHLRRMFCRKGWFCMTMKLQFGWRSGQCSPERRSSGAGKSLRRSQVAGAPPGRNRPNSGHVSSPVWSGMKIIVNIERL